MVITQFSVASAGALIPSFEQVTRIYAETIIIEMRFGCVNCAHIINEVLLEIIHRTHLKEFKMDTIISKHGFVNNLSVGNVLLGNLHGTCLMKCLKENKPCFLELWWFLGPWIMSF